MRFHANGAVQSWGRIGARSHELARPRFLDDLKAWNTGGGASRLAIGNRRSYSDVGLSDGGRLVDMTGMDRFRSFDPATGLLVADAGVTLDAILKTFVPRGYFLPVTPGTRFATLGGAVANDVHGKNHHVAGTFGCHVEALTVQRSDAGEVRASPTERPELFAATIGGLGLTGIVSQVAIRLQPIASSSLDVETIACDDFDSLCAGLEAGDAGFEHNVAWIDCSAKGRRLGRGLLSRANWAKHGDLRVHRDPRRAVPTDRLDGLLNPLTLRLFNAAYHRMGAWRAGRAVTHYEPFLYPLDGIRHWNRLYGRHGFYQYQCVIPAAAGREPVRAMLAEIAASGEGSFLAVLKRFGSVASPGLLSFPMPGLTLALDFRNRDARTLAILSRLDAIVAEAQGRLYPAKDQRMPRDAFINGYDALGRFALQVDDSCQSEFRTRMSL